MKTCLAAALAGVLACAPVWAEQSPVDREPESATDHDHQSGDADFEVPARLDPVIVTAPFMLDPYRIETDPRQPRAGMPANDGGGYLKAIPGFGLSRKGGSGGDPVLRGLGGSRLNILMDDSEILGGCGGRMDPPTAYAFPEAYDRIEVIKGPQSVRYGTGSAGLVRFERDRPRFNEPATEGYAGTTLGGFERQDFTGEVTSGGPHGYARLMATTATQGDYRDGNGQRVHSAYERWSNSAVLGWMPDELTHVSFTYERSDARAAYDDRGMDGTSFERTGYSLRASREGITSWLEQLEGQLFQNYIDHVMDNFRLRAPAGMPMIRYPDRLTRGARVSATLSPSRDWELVTGADWSANKHRDNRLMGPDAFEYRSIPRNDTAEFTELGVFLEAEKALNQQQRVNAGVRFDENRVLAKKSGGFGGAAAGSRDRSRQTSGFIRYSHDLGRPPFTVYAGLGRSERAPDFWERQRAFDLSDESLTQLDLGLQYRGRQLMVSLALFLGRTEDHILIVEPGREADTARGVEARTRGAEMDLQYQLYDHWQLEASLALLRSHNESDDEPLAQTPPHEATLGLVYDTGKVSAGLHWRGVARQDRIHPGYGTIYGLDSRETPGFGALSLYASRELGQDFRVSLGLDNLLDKAYTEHIQRGEAELGAEPTRIREPGRSAWLRLAVDF